MSDLESTDGAQESATSGECLRQHPRVVRLRQQVSALPVDQECRSRLYRTIDLYADRIVARPEYEPCEGRADLDVVQALAQADLNERNLMTWIESCRRTALEER